MALDRGRLELSFHAHVVYYIDPEDSELCLEWRYGEKHLTISVDDTDGAWGFMTLSKGSIREIQIKSLDDCIALWNWLLRE